MVYYKQVMKTINIISLVKVIINIVVRHYGPSEFIINNKDFLFISKFWFLLFYSLNIKQKLSTVFYFQINSHTKIQNSRIEA